MTTAAALMLIGRVIFGAFFAIAGVRNFVAFPARAAGPTNYGWLLPNPLMALGFAIQLAGGLALIFGIGVVPAVVALIVFLVVATTLFHNALAFPRGERDLHVYLTLVNVTLAAGLLMVASAGL